MSDKKKPIIEDAEFVGQTVEDRDRPEVRSGINKDGPVVAKADGKKKKKSGK